MSYKKIKYVIINDTKDPSNIICLSVYSIVFGGLEKADLIKFTKYLIVPNIEKTNTNVVI